MSRRWMVVGGAVLVAVAVAVGVVLVARGGGGGGEPVVGDRLAEALSYAPANAQVVAELEVEAGSEQGGELRELARTFPAARFASDAVRVGARRLGLDADEDLPSILGGPIVVSGPAAAVKGLSASITALRLDLAAVASEGATAVVVGRSPDDVEATLHRAVDDGRLRRLGDLPGGIEQYAVPGAQAQPPGATAGSPTPARIGVRNGTVVLAANAAALRRAFATHDAHLGTTRAGFDRRLGPLAHVPALIRAAGDAKALLSARAHGVPWVDALRTGSLAVSITNPGVRLRVHLETDPEKVTDADLPLAPGPQQPRPAPGPRRVYVAVRGLNQTIHVLDAAKGGLDLPFLQSFLNALSTLDSVKGPLKTFGRIDADALIDQLTGTTTITPESGTKTFALRAGLDDGAPLRKALNRLAAVPDFLVGLAGVRFNLSHEGDTYTITRDGRPYLKALVKGNTLVVTDDQRADLQAIAARPLQPAPPGETPGALAFHVAGPALQDQLIQRLRLPGLARIVLGGFGDLNGSARAQRSGVDLDATLRLNR